MVEEEPTNHNSDLDPDEYDKTPWIFKEIRKAQLSKRIKMFFLGVGILIGIYFMFKWFGWYFLFGLLPAPAWYFWALRQIDRESYTLIEVRLKGDQVTDYIFSDDTQTNIYQIPPDMWKEMKKVGNPYTVGRRIYICEYLKYNEDKDEWTVFFSDDPNLSNLTFHARVKLWFELKRQLPYVTQQLAIYKWGTEDRSMEDATRILEKIGLWRLDGSLNVKRTVYKKAIQEVEDGQRA